MRIRDLAAGVIAVLATQAVPAAAQRTGDRARLVFTVSGGYVEGKGLWRVPNQQVQGDVFDVSRATDGRLGGGMAGTYYKGENFGLTADIFAFELAYADACQLVGPAQSPRNAQGCADIDQTERAALGAVISVGAIFRFASREPISPFARASAGILISNQSSLQTEGEVPLPDGTTALVRVYDDPRQSRVGPAFAIGVGTTTPIGKGFQLRWEVRDNIVGIQRVTGPATPSGIEPPHGIGFKHLFSVLIGMDIVLERQRGRRY